LYRQVPLFEERHEANTARGDAQRRLERLLAHPHDGGFNLREDDVRVVQQQKLVEELIIAARDLSSYVWSGLSKELPVWFGISAPPRYWAPNS
jgi:hypothetical protein